MKKGSTLADILRETTTDIVIPRLQRNYAQGRKSAEDIREAFASAIVQALSENSAPLSLDYIYGRSRGYGDEQHQRKELVLLDGQQRLTTLFLLHWLLAVREHVGDTFLNLFAREENGVSKSRFYYKTRKSANDFCNFLIKIVQEDMNQQIDLGNEPSSFLRDRVEYRLEWSHDPTVEGMLNMLDALQKGLEKLPTGAFERLIAPLAGTAAEETRPIFFYLLDEESTANFSLDEERQKDTKLFITMNSRGLPLTAFENFKAELGIFLGEIELTQISQTDETDGPCAHFLWKMDTTWSNFFWRNRPGNANAEALYDNAFMNFMRLYWLMYYSGTKEPKDEALNYLRTKTETNKDTAHALTFARLRKYGILPLKDDKENRNRCRQTFIELEKNLDYFSGLNALGQNDLLIELERYFNLKENFNEIVSGQESQGYAFNILWYAYSRYIARPDTSGITSWMRVIWNLVENTRLYYDNITIFCQAIRSVDNLLAKLCNQSIIEVLAQSDFSESFSGFRDDQMKEERIKAWLMCHDTPEHGWHNAIIMAEAHPYFKGQIGFLLTYAGIKLDGFPQENMDLADSLKQFIKYYEKASKLFECEENTDGISRKNDEDFCFERAVLCKWNYLEGTGKLNLRSKDIRSGNVLRDHSWKRYLRDDDATRKGVREVLDDQRFSLDNISTRLNQICKETTVAEPWRNCLIKCPGLFEYCKRGFIFREENKVTLFGTSQFNQYHTDLFL